MNIAVRIEPAAAAPAEVDYRWDPDTDILTASLRGSAAGEGMSGSLGVEGSDGSWIMFDVAKGRINGVEVAVWPEVRKRGSLQPPSTVEDASVTVPSRASQPGIASLEMDTSLMAEADVAERNFHFAFGKPRPVRAVRIAQDILLDVDPRGRVAGLWLLNVPPFPADQ